MNVEELKSKMTEQLGDSLSAGIMASAAIFSTIDDCPDVDMRNSLASFLFNINMKHGAVFILEKQLKIFTALNQPIAKSVVQKLLARTKLELVEELTEIIKQVEKAQNITETLGARK